MPRYSGVIKSTGNVLSSGGRPYVGFYAANVVNAELAMVAIEATLCNKAEMQRAEVYHYLPQAPEIPATGQRDWGNMSLLFGVSTDIENKNKRLRLSWGGVNPTVAAAPAVVGYALAALGVLQDAEGNIYDTYLVTSRPGRFTEQE